MGTYSLLRNTLVIVVTVLLIVVPVRNSSSAINNCTLSVARNPSGVCPTWFVPSSRDGKQCECGRDFQKGVKCQSDSNSTLLMMAYCMTYNKKSKLTFLGECPYNTIPESTLFYPLPENVLQLNEQMCGPLNRTGLLCSQCQQGLGPAVLSYYRECVECMDEPYGWILYIFLATFPQTILCLFVIIFRINVASPSLNGFVLAAQLITNIMNTTPSNTVSGDYKIPRIIVVTCYGFWNLDFFSYVFPSFCIKEGMSTLTVIALEYTVALYPIFFTVVVYYCITYHDNGCRVLVCCWRPIRWCFIRFRGTWELKGSVINAFATFLLLSYSKLCSISFSLLRSVLVYDICGNRSQRVYHELSYENLSNHHLSYVISASITLIVLICLPALFILFYQNKVFQKCLNFCNFKFVLIHELANICQGCFKNGTTPGTRDYRWFAGLYLLLRIVVIVAINQKYYSLILIVVSCIMAMLVALLRPYRVDFYNKLDSVVSMLFAIRTAWCVYAVDYEGHSPDGNQVLALVPLAYIICLVAWRLIIFTVKKFQFESLIQRVKSFIINTAGTITQDDVTEDDQLPDRILQPSEYTPLVSGSKRLTLNSNTQQSVQSNDTY